jgi:hypothetical protein
LGFQREKWGWGNLGGRKTQSTQEGKPQVFCCSASF